MCLSVIRSGSIISLGPFHNLTRPDHSVEVAQALDPDLLLFDMSDASLEDWRLLTLTRSEPSLDSTQLLITALDAQNDRGALLGVRDVFGFPLREQAVNQVLDSAFSKDIQNAKILVFVDEPQTASVRAFFENLGGMQIHVLNDPEQAEQVVRDQAFDGFILALTLPWETYERMLHTIIEESDSPIVPPVIGLLPEADHPRELEQVVELAEQCWTHADRPKDDFSDRLIAHLQTLA
jgi:CheY-like chemotaxis protein